MEKWMFWAWLEKTHPVIYEMVWLGIMAMSAAALIISIIQIARR